MATNHDNEPAGPCRVAGEPFHGFAAVVVRTAHLHDSMFKLSELMKLHRVFQQRGALNEKQFVGHFRSILETNSWSSTQISQLFMKIDANSDGSVDWDEFTNFMFVHSQSAHDAAAQLASVAFVPTDDVTAAAQAPSPCQPRVRDVLVAFQPLGTGHFVSSTVDGMIKTWSATWAELSSFRALQDHRTNCVTAMAYLQSSGKVALASLHGGVQFFDLVSADKSPQSHVPTGSLNHSTPLALCTMLDDDTGLDVLYVGDDVGGVTKICLGATWHMCDGDCPEHDTVTIQSTDITRKERHTDHVTRLAFVADLNSVVSSSRDGSVKVVDVHRGVLKRHFALHRGAVYDFVWCPRPKFFASCGVEREILLWSPFSDSLLGRLRGHSCSIKSVVWNEEGQNLISLGLDDGTIRVWDVRQLKCLQVMRDPTHGNQHCKLIYFDVASKHLLTFSNTITPWPMHHAAVPSDTLQPHEAAVIKAMFNPSFQQLVTMDSDGRIVLWNVLDGSVISHFFMANTSITAAALDDTGRRLITGSNVGTQVTLWNFSNGSRLATLSKRRHTHEDSGTTDRPTRPSWMHHAPMGARAVPTLHTQPARARKPAPKANEVTGVALITVSVAHSSGRGFTQAKYILSVGWDRRVYVWHDSSDQDYVMRMPEDLSVGHTDDILTMAFCAQKFIATGGMDGCVILWGFNSGDVVAKFPLTASIEALLYPRKLGLLVVVTSCASVLWINPRFSLLHATVDLAPILHADVRLTKVDTDGILLLVALSCGVVVVFQTSDPVQEPSMSLRQLHRWKAYESEHEITAMEYIESSSIADTFVVTASHLSIKLWTLAGALVGSFGSTTWRIHDAVSVATKAPPRGAVSGNACMVVEAAVGHTKAIDTYKREVNGLTTRGPPAVDDVWMRHDIHGTLIDVVTLTSISRNKGMLEGLDNAGRWIEVAFHDLYEIHEDYVTWARHDFFTTLVGRVWQEHAWAAPFKASRLHFDEHGEWHLVDTAGTPHALPSEEACKAMNHRPFRSLALHRMIPQPQPPFPQAVPRTGYQTLLESTPTTSATTNHFSDDLHRQRPSMLFSPSKGKDGPIHTHASRPLVLRDGRTSPTKLSLECRAVRLPQVGASSPTKASSTSPASLCPTHLRCPSPPRGAARDGPPQSPKTRKDDRKIHALQIARGPPDVPVSKTWDFYLPDVDKT
ncbi:hypothetical protein, variant 4 [Aphanomyces invadans]|uniref:EF-hand domain-containing protein n=2 Tax=Aphanomyces invadans TaxID=157072 RepID=A0A024UGB6_9STRA|nr:hypothetical protein, variant 4 [Aphanomyces invadans]XP_008866769.1 hypothetical protein, variant 3 [Aphanomyces invadans]ETW05329.1 hypothetical protein, variant 3 [Aphanomyces invadans]ETW05330.1 hypothetical protein, variant 4 [Aphanomyces invadans]|eukprot:XP_008866764.1 hypothetical protein, variant 4 [Aphanomyces invadans]